MKRILNAIGGFFAAMWAGKASRVLLLIAGAMLTAAAAAAVCLFDESVVAENKARSLVQAYDEAVSAAPQAQIPLATTKPDPMPVTIEGHQVMGKLEIPKIEAELPVIAYTDDEALKVSVCYYQGPMPDEAGNLVITGHHYANGAHFGRLDELNKGDDVILSMPDGSVYRYVVDEKKVIRPDDTAALDDAVDGHVLTLLTCTNHGNGRLLVRCALQDGN